MVSYWRLMQVEVWPMLVRTRLSWTYQASDSLAGGLGSSGGVGKPTGRFLIGIKLLWRLTGCGQNSLVSPPSLRCIVFASAVQSRSSSNHYKDGQVRLSTSRSTYDYSGSFIRHQGVLGSAFSWYDVTPISAYSQGVILSMEISAASYYLYNKMSLWHVP